MNWGKLGEMIDRFKQFYGKDEWWKEEGAWQYDLKKTCQESLSPQGIEPGNIKDSLSKIHKKLSFNLIDRRITDSFFNNVFPKCDEQLLSKSFQKLLYSNYSFALSDSKIRQSIDTQQIAGF